MVSDHDFFSKVEQNMNKESTYRITLQPEPTLCKNGDSGEMVNRFLPKDFFRDYLIRRVKQLAMENGFKIKMPYADRCDKLQKTRTINFYCHMSKSANRKVLTNSCPFRAIFKMKMGYLKS